MQTIIGLATGAAALCVAGAVGAATITFDTFASTNGDDKLSPIVTVSDGAAPSTFDVSVTQSGSSEGSLRLLAFDLAMGSMFTVSGVTNATATGSQVFAQQMGGCSLNGNNGRGTFCAGMSIPLGGNNNNLNGASLPAFDEDVVLAFNNKDDVAQDASTTLTFSLAFTDMVSLSDFQAAGLRFQDANNAEGSDKLIDNTPDRDGDMNVVPLPAAGWLLAAGIGGLGAVARRRRADRAA